ncbi:MAG: hypothetical protein ACMXX5_01330, partial [Candidatus Woesearchaeota archaeon]
MKQENPYLKKECLTFYFGFILIYIGLGIFNYINRSQWIIDNILSMASITILLFLVPRLKFRKWEYFFCCIGFLIHNLGTFGFYELSFGFLNYDDIVHLTTTAIAGYVLFNFLAKSIIVNNIKQSQKKPKLNSLNKAVIMILAVVSIVTLLGVFIEQVEFMGFMYLGPGEGILFYGSGDGENPGEVRSQYIDTMKDMNMNFIGALSGSLFYYF